jgi:aspartate/methionine/tyrosine aminotransferase
MQSGHTHYGPAQGIPELRTAVATRMARDFGLEVDPKDEVIITTGATMGICIALQAVVNPGDEVIIFDPVYDPYPSVVRLAGGIPVRVLAQERKGHFSVSPQAIEHALTGRTKAMLLNNPWNPTGTVMTQDELQTLVNLAEAHNLVLIADEIYENILFDGHSHHHLAALSPTARAHTITVNSFSKSYAMTGWRIGYNIAPPHLTRAMLRVTQQMSRSAATFIQLASVAALDGPQDAVIHMRQSYGRRRELLADGLAQGGLSSFHPPEGTFFALLDIRPYGQSSQEVADYLLKQARVVTVPASLYGAAGEGFVRLSFAYGDDNITKGVAAITEALARLK